MKNSLDIKSLLFGALFATILTFAIGAAKNQPEGKEISPVRFRVLDATTPQVEWTHGGKLMVLKLKPFYGKISKDSNDWRLKNETQELILAILVEPDYEIGKDDIIGFQANQHLKSTK